MSGGLWMQPESVRGKLSVAHASRAVDHSLQQRSPQMYFPSDAGFPARQKIKDLDGGIDFFYPGDFLILFLDVNKIVE